MQGSWLIDYMRQPCRKITIAVGVEGELGSITGSKIVFFGDEKLIQWLCTRIRRSWAGFKTKLPTLLLDSNSTLRRKSIWWKLNQNSSKQSLWNFRGESERWAFFWFTSRILISWGFRILNPENLKNCKFLRISGSLVLRISIN